MDTETVVDVLQAEAAALVRGLEQVPEGEWRCPTRCDPWDVAGLVGHVAVALDRVAVMLNQPAPRRAEVSAQQYYRGDHRFSADANAERVAVATQRSTSVGGSTAIVEHLRGVTEQLVERCRAEPPGRLVRTRHGDDMTLADFLVTRVVELALHGIDLADALERPSWLTPGSGDLVVWLLLGDDGPAGLEQLGWEQGAFLRRATGRDRLSANDADWVASLDVNWLSLG